MMMIKERKNRKTGGKYSKICTKPRLNCVLLKKKKKKKGKPIYESRLPEGINILTNAALLWWMMMRWME
jgi:hypothetical protein